VVLAGARGYSNEHKIRSHVPWDIGGLMKTWDGGRTFQRSTILFLGLLTGGIFLTSSYAW
jgi:hypothetical protein